MIENLFNLEGKTALVTGGAKGIGAMITQGLVESGVKVYISSRSAAACEAFAEKMSQYGTCIPLPTNLLSLENISELAAKLSEKEDKLDILINNSGVSWGAPLESFPEKGWDKVMDLNVKSVFFLTQSLLPLLKAASSTENPGRIINISSIAGITHGGLQAISYNASKAAVNQLTKVLAHELASKKILVNAIAPGFFPTNMTAHFDKEQLEKASPIHRVGQPTDIAGLVIYLCSKAGSFMTGNIIPLDGGLLVG
jgi:NAD(P)-dependent dehydrogenase (short-subunit alcohol dehydrogenase family)